MSELYHHGIKGQRWYRRLYQNKDGTLTPLGKIRYRKSNSERSNIAADSKQAESKSGHSGNANALKTVEKKASEKEYITNRRNLRKLDLTKMDDASLSKLKTRLSLEKDVAGIIQDLSPVKERRIKKAISEAAYKSFENAVNQLAAYAVAKVINAQIGENVVRWK